MRKNIKTTVLARPDVLEFLGLLGNSNVRYLIFGGCAVMYYVGNRYTCNVDIWVSKDTYNIRSLLKVLNSFGAPLAGLSEEDFCQEGHFYQIGNPPVRIDDMLSTRGISFDEAWNERRLMKLNGMRIPFISKNHLIKGKNAAGRSQDIIDVHHLQKMARSRK
jgi:hypothetical protein